MKTNWLLGGASYMGRSPKVDPTRSINFYAEIGPNPNAKSPLSLIGTPGSVVSVDSGFQDEVRGEYSFAGYMFFVVGSNAFKWDGTTLTTIGTLNTSSDRISFSDNGLLANGVGGNHLLIVDGVDGYVYDVSTSVWTIIDRTASGYIGSVTVTNPGSGYTAIPTVTVTGGSGSGATLTAAIALQVDSIVGANGLGYKPGDIIEMAVADGDTESTPAKVKVLTLSCQEVIGIVPNGGYKTGTGYSVNDLLTLVGGTCTTPAVLKVKTVDGSGAVTSVSIVDVGSGYTVLPPNRVATDYAGAGSGAKFWAYWGVETVDVITLGNYVTLPPLPLIQATPSKAVSATIISAGSGYAVGDMLTGTTLYPGHVVGYYQGGHLISPFQFTITKVNASGGVKTVKLVDGGEYINTGANPYQTITDGDGDGNCILNVTWDSGSGLSLDSWGVSEIIVEDGGKNYLSEGTTITITGGYPTTQATAEPTITINNGGFPTNPKMAAFIDGYFNVISGMSHYTSDLYDGLTWNPLAAASCVSSSDDVSAVIAYKQQLFLIKNFEFEIWYNTGSPTSIGSPFAKLPGITIGYGTKYPWAIAQGGDRIFFLGCQRTSNDSQSEFAGVVQLYGYASQVISPPNITYRIANWPKTNAFAYCYTEDSHTFYVLTDPDADETLVYDLNTMMWHERSTYREVDSPSVIGRHFGNCYASFNGSHYLGDYRTGRILEMSSDYFTDCDDPILSIRISDHFRNQELENAFISRLYLDAETGGADSTFSDPPMAQLSWSNDGGYIWSNEYEASLGKTGEYLTRLIWRRLGYAKQRVFKLVISEAIRKILISSYAEMS